MGKTDRLDSLDLLRGTAILMVVAFHVGSWFETPVFLKGALGLGNLGVQLFFLISAVTMCHMWDKRRGESHPSLKFYIRRAFRIAPPFWFALVVYMVWRTLGGFGGLGDIGPWDVALSTFFLHGFSVHSINLVVPGGWSIAVEMSFYVLFPFLVRTFKTPLSRVLLAFGLYLAGVALTQVLEPLLPGEHGAVELFLYYSLLTEFPIFPLGMALYAVVLGKQKIDGKVALVAVLWLGVAFLGKNLGILSRPFFWLEVFLLVGLMALVLTRGWNFTVLNWGGRWSYSIYLFHFAVLEFLVTTFGAQWLAQGVANYLVGLVATAGLTALVAWASSHTLEAWSTTWARLIIKKMKP